jgi:hypothetical protein
MTKSKHQNLAEICGNLWKLAETHCLGARTTNFHKPQPIPINFNRAFIVCILLLLSQLSFSVCDYSFAQEKDEVKFSIDTASVAIPLPGLFRPNIDLSGRGFYRDFTLPQTQASEEILESWGANLGFNSLYRIQYDLWQISQLAKDKQAQDKLLANYEKIIKRITDSGGTVILNIFGTPAGLGEVLDKKSPPRDLKKFKQNIKDIIRQLSCEKRYNIWYEVWNAPDLESFFLGRKQDYLNLYRVVAESVKELEEETKIHIPVGGPSTSWWFQNVEGNTAITPERSLIYELIRFCAQRHLPLDFISWHGFSTSPRVEKERTIYNNNSVSLIRDWLSYFDFNRDTFLIIDEWNFDSGANILAERRERSNVSASYLLSRIINMYQAGIDRQIYFCLEDFKNNTENLTRDVGVFAFDQDSPARNPKVTYNLFRMLSCLGNEMLTPQGQDDFLGVIATKDPSGYAIILYNYIDPQAAVNYLSENISHLNGAERKILLNIIKSAGLEKIVQGRVDLKRLRATKKIKAILKKAAELNLLIQNVMTKQRKVQIEIKNLEGGYSLERYVIDSSCTYECTFQPAQTKEITCAGGYQEELDLSPYSVEMFLLKKKLPVEENAQSSS